jgi:DNA-binding transcriptional MerR regulator/methylmalonyl-CoA mutase cobalamin-binding subunit
MSHEAMDTTSHQARHTIAVVSRQTGITQLLLRAWERRYGAVVPERTPTGRRLYSDEDVKKLRMLRLLTEADHRIGDVASLSMRELEDLATEITPVPVPAPRPTDAEAAPDRLLGEALQAVADMDAPALERTLQHAAVVLSRPVLRRDLIQPLLEEIGERWRAGDLRVAHEHLATAIVRNFLFKLRSGGSVLPSAPVMVAATLSGQIHDLGALMAAGHAEEMGWKAFFLGADLPAEEIAATALERGARAVVLSLVYPSHDPGTAEQLRTLRRVLGPGPVLMVGGAAAPTYAAVITEIDAVLVTDVEVLDRRLRALS